MIYKELFEYVLDRNFISENNDSIMNENGYITYPNNDLTVRLINHFYLIDRLIESFLYFRINLVLMAEKASYNLYIFNDIKYESSENCNLQQNIIPKFNSRLSDDCLIKIMQYLTNKNKLDNPNSDVWLYWFNRKNLKIPQPLNWKGTPTMLSNVIQHLCGESISNTIKTAFGTKYYVKPTRKVYESEMIYKEIEQIITISKQKIN